MSTITTTATNRSGSACGSRRRPFTARAAAFLAAVVASVVALGLASTPVLADDCPNAALRAQNSSTDLPDCRAYELVSPVFKEGFTAGLQGVADGRLAYMSNGNYANNGYGIGGIPGGNQYVASRAGSGWFTKALAPSAPDFVPSTPGLLYGGKSVAVGLSNDLRSSLWQMRRADQSDDVADLYVRRPDDVFMRIGSSGDPLAPLAIGASVFQTSDDLSHVVFGAGSGGIYEYVGTDGDQPRRVDLDNAGQPLAPGCHTTAGSGSGSYYHAISVDGRVIFWTCDDESVYARVNGTTTIDASQSQCTRAPSDPGGACAAGSRAIFQGANADGTRVYFTTDHQLVNSDTDDTDDLYECDIPAGTPTPAGSANSCPDLREVSGADTGASVQGVTRISDDGSHVYFVATGVLASNTGANDALAAAGDDNLYVWTRDATHPAGETRFIAKLDPADAGSGNGAGLWNIDLAGRYAQATDDGRYLVFATRAQLIDHGPQADTDTARDIYRYEAETGAVTRLSIGADGQGGNEPGHDANFTVIAYHVLVSSKKSPRTAMSDDGGSVVFTTDDALAPSDTNGTVDTYLWHDGRVTLISSGKPSEDHNFTVGNEQPLSTSIVILALISPSGRDVYFTTTARLVASDVDTVMDTYDARVDGGFDLSTPPTCSGDACQGGRSAPPPASKPDSTSSTGQDGPPQTPPAFRVGKLTASQLRRVALTGKVSLPVVTNAPGTLSATATAPIATRSSSVGSAKRSVSKAGTVSLSLTLSKKARAELKRARKLTVKVLVRQDNVAIARAVSLKLTRPKAAKRGQS
jgi:hypothetical protein